MRLSLSLAAVALICTFVSGFSAVPSRTTAFRVPTSYTTKKSFLAEVRGGGAKLKASTTANSECPVSGKIAAVSSLWGTGGVIYILAKAIKRVMPIAMEPFGEAAVALTPIQLG